MTEYYDDKGFHHESYRDYVFTELLGYCGCYDSQLFDDVFRVLLAYDVPASQIPYYDKIGLSPSEYVELILHDLSRWDVGLLDHGTTVRASHITDKGREVAAKVREEMNEKEGG